MTNANQKLLQQIDAIRIVRAMPAFRKWRNIAAKIIGDMQQMGRFFKSNEGPLYFDGERLRPYTIHKDDTALMTLLDHKYGINGKEMGFNRVLSSLIAEATGNGSDVTIQRFAHFDAVNQRLYVSRFDGYMYRLDGAAVEKIKNGTDDVFFFDSENWEPYEYSENTAGGELNRQLVESINFEDGHLSTADQRLLLKLWIMAVFFGSIQPTKIILLLLGEHGSGKTSALRRIQKFFFGQKADLFSIEKDKQDGFVATITTDPVALFDNLDEKISWLPYNLSRLATGVTFTRRILYTTNTKAEFPAVSWIGITCRTVDFMAKQPDLPDRTLILRLARLEERLSEAELVAATLKNRNAMWSELLDRLNAVVKYIRENPQAPRVHFRMADFASFALKVATLWGCREQVEDIFTKLEAGQADLVLEDEPICEILSHWLMKPENHGRWVYASDLNKEWAGLASLQGMYWSAPDPRALGRRLGQLRVALSKRFGMEVRTDKHDDKNIYRFWPKSPLQEAVEANAIKPDEMREEREENGLNPDSFNQGYRRV